MSKSEGIGEPEFHESVRARYSDVEIDLILELVSHVPIAVWAASGADSEYAVRLWNSGAEQLYGFTKEEVLGKNYIETFVNPLEKAQAIQDHEAIITTREPYRNLARDHREDGTTRLLLTQGMALWHPVLEQYLQGEIAVDVTQVPTKDRDWLEQVLTPEVARELLASFIRLLSSAFLNIDAMMGEAEALIRTFLGEAAASIFLLERNGRLDVVGGNLNPSMARCEFDPQAVVNWCMAVERDHLMVDYTDHLVPRPHGRERKFPTSLRRREQLPFAVTLLRDEANRPKGGIFVYLPEASSFSELTESYLATLSWTIRAELAIEDRLAKSKQAVRLVAMQRDRQTTLRLAEQYRHSVLKKAHLLQINTALLEEATSLDEVKKITRTLAAMALSFHDVAYEFESQLEITDFTLFEMLSSVTGAVMQMYPGVKMARDLSGRDVTIRGVAPFIEGAFENLLINAVEAMSYAGRIGVWSKFTRGGRGSLDIVSVYFCDDGPGIPPGIHSRLGEQGVSTKGDERGFGLYIALMSIKESGGDMVQERQPGWNGVCWRLTFPVVKTVTADHRD